ncbi:MAG: DNA repair protein RecN [Oscillospiraceae bacterium]|nr:DNA repair protein RecN [Oscillospiraceae bacterium]MDD4368336.1 DNA repair protein RecN [Oscillospiraceae bacterium]
MLVRLEIQHFALLDQIIWEPGPGLNIITGETGAGKSLLLDAIGAVAGKKVTKDSVRSGCEWARAEAVFDQPESSLSAELLADCAYDPEEGNLILTRELNRSGKSLCRINGRLVPQKFLREVGDRLLDIHGQHAQQGIYNPATHRQLLDRFAGASLAVPLQAYQAVYDQLQVLTRQVTALGGDPEERRRRADFLLFQAQEIEQARIRPREDVLLQQKREKLEHAERLSEGLARAVNCLSSQGSDSTAAAWFIGQALDATRSLESYDPTLAELSSQLLDLQAAAQDLAASLTRRQEELTVAPDLLARIDSRLDQLFRLKQKYGQDLTQVVAYGVKAREAYEKLASAEEKLAALDKNREDLQQQLQTTGTLLTRARQQAAERLAGHINRQLTDLGMPHAKFMTRFEPVAASQAERWGLDRLEFLFSANPGEAPKPLAKIASGGEASRILLAIRVILAEAEPLQLLIFDEIDAGVSGKTASLVGHKLRDLAAHTQVMCVTHTPQVAAWAQNHYYIEKQVAEGKTHTELRALDQNGHLDELARLLAGETDPVSAKQLAESLSHFPTSGSFAV